MITAALAMLVAFQVSVGPQAHAQTGLPAASTIKLGILKRDGDGQITLDRSRKALAEARREQRQRLAKSRSCAVVAPSWIRSLVDATAPAYGVEPALVLAVMAVESNFRVKAVSPKNARGLMQLIPATARRFGVRDSFDPRDNIQGGVKYLRWLLTYFNGNLTHALAGYNAGEKAVDKYNGIPPYRETQNYVRAVQRLYGCSSPKRTPAKPPKTAFVNPWAPPESAAR